MQDKYSDRILLSHDDGWYWVGQKNGGEIRNFNYLNETFLCLPSERLALEKP